MRRCCTVVFVFMLAVIILFSLFDPLSWLPGSGVPRVPPPDRRAASGVEHLGAYLVLATAGWLGLSAPGRLIPFLGSLLLLGAALEAVQIFLPGRTADILDLAANSLGILLGLLIASLVMKARFRAN